MYPLCSRPQPGSALPGTSFLSPMQLAVAISNSEMHLALAFPFVDAWWVKAASSTNQLYLPGLVWLDRKCWNPENSLLHCHQHSECRKEILRALWHWVQVWSKSEWYRSDIFSLNSCQAQCSAWAMDFGLSSFQMTSCRKPPFISPQLL